MTIEDLMQPRYKVIADYPGNTIYEVGHIIISRQGLVYCDPNGAKFSDYPHLFKRLKWWEERKIEDLPEYAKVKYGDDDTDEIYALVHIDGDKRYWFYYTDGELFGYKIKSGGGQIITSLLPATLEEYNSYINNHQP
jgi:hypothetical protein